jgi:hypothetical protein
MPGISHNEKDLEYLQPHHWLFWRSYCPSRCCCSWCLPLSFECPPFVVVSFSFQTYWKILKKDVNSTRSILWRMLSLYNKYKQFIIHNSHRHEVKSSTLMHIIRKEEYALFKHFDHRKFSSSYWIYYHNLKAYQYENRYSKGMK